MTRPLIGLTMTDVKTGKGRAQVATPYMAAIQAAGGTPVLLPPQVEGEALDALLGALQGVVLTGGADVDPGRYGQEPHPTVNFEFVSPERDAMEVRVVEYALERGLPVLAICRGMQVLNVALGGTLIQDIPSCVEGALQHQVGDAGDEPYHAVRLEEGSALARVTGSVEFEVNSRHHQSLDRLGDGLKAVAWAPDGVVEGAEMPGRATWLLAVQWHPEDLAARQDEARRLFEGVVEAAEG